MKKGILSLLLCGAMLFSLCPQSALAAGNGQTETECICASLCTTEIIEEDCHVCGAENADFALCEGEAETTVLSNAEAVYRVAGDAALCDSNWDSGDDNNRMTHNPDTGLYEKTFSSVASGDYQLKVVKNGETWYGTSDDSNFVIRVSAACDVTITFDAETETVGVRGNNVVQKTWMEINGIYVVGNGSEVWLNGESWDPAAEENKMTEISSGIYEITYEDVPAGEDYEFKFAANGNWLPLWGGGGAEGEAVYNSNQSITFRLRQTSNVTLRLDLTNYNDATKSGAVYSIIGAGVPYLAANGSQQSCNSYTVVDTTTTTWNEGWYVAEGDVTIPDSVTLTGNVHLILTDGCNLNVDGGISGNEDSALTIYAQSTEDRMGNLTVTGGGQTEGVSTGIFVNGEFTLNGGNVISTGGTADNESNGIRTNAGIKISGGSVTAIGGSSEGMSTGIYTEYGVEISGGTVTATGGEATGGQWTGSFGIFSYSGVEISGGSITATGGSSEGISTGIRANAGIKISGGTVMAICDRAKYESIGIYAFYDKITITGGTVTATGGSSEGISMGIRAESGIEISGGIVTATGGSETGLTVLSSGIYTVLGVKISGGIVTATGSAVTASGDSTQITSEGIVVIRGDITITGGSVTATGGAATGGERATSHGIYVIGESESSACNITITGDAQVTATAGAAVAESGAAVAESGPAVAESCGIVAICIVTGAVPEEQGPVGSINIADNAQVIATGGTVTGGEMPFTYGIGASGGITVNGGHVIAETQSTSGTHSALGVAPALPNTTYWWRTAETDTFTTSADSAYFYSDAHTYVEITDKEPTCVTFDPNGGVVNPTGAITDIFGRLTSLPTPTRSGRYRFDGWYTAAEGGTKITTDTVFSENTTVYAQWTYSGGGGGGGTTRYTVSFETNGGSKITSQSVTRNTAMKEPTAPTKDGYTFDGWYSDKELKTAYDFDTKVAKSFTLYAKWTEKATELDKPTEPVEPTDPTTPEWKNPFTDVSENDWYYDNVKYAYKNGLMSGTTNTTFAPNESLTRGMLVAILYRAEGEPAVNKSIPFSDVDINAYYANAFIWAQQNGIVNGVTENAFAPDDNITREQIAAIMFRYAKYKGYDVSVGENTNILSYTDFDEISEYAISAMQYAVGSGLMKGKTESTINPKDFATRAEIAAILQRFLEANK